MNANRCFLKFFAASAVLVSGLALAAGGLLDRSYRPLTGKTPVNLQQQYGGKVLLVVNTASKCGLAPQFEALEALNAKYQKQGFAVLGFPSGDFMNQEYGDEKKIQEFCTLTYGVKFPMFEKVHVKGKEATPLYLDLIKATGDTPEWNFHKYLISRDGKVVGSFASRTVPDDKALVAAIERELKTPAPVSKR